MPDHVNPTLLAIGLVTGFGFRFVALVVFLRIMIHFQKLNFTWLPLIGAAFLAAAFDMVPLVGHYLAVPVLYLCIWKITNCDLFPDAVFTVVLSYALTYMVTLIALAYVPVPGFHTAGAQDNFGDETNTPAVAVVQPANPTADTPAAPDSPDSKIAAGISVKGVSGVGNNALVTIQYGKKDYIISLGEGVTISTDGGLASVRFLEADGDIVKLAVNGQTVKYPVY